MGWDDDDDDTPRRISDAMETDVNLMRELLVQHPEFLRIRDGYDFWLHDAARNGNLPAVKVLVELGIDVNEPRMEGELEGPIKSAAANGQLEVVRWLLEHGANINFEKNGKNTCFTLRGAAIEGHLDVVKLLVEHGADIHAEWHGVNSLMDAEFYGHDDVAAYLRSLGAQDVRATTPPDYVAAHQKLIQNMIERQGQPSDWQLEIPGDPLVTIHHIPADPAHEEFIGQTLFTIGLSDHRLPDSFDEFYCQELRIRLSPDWPLTDAALADPQWNWPVEWMKRIAIELRSADKMIAGYPPFFMNGDPPQPLVAGSGLCGWMGLRSSSNHCQMSDYRWISLLDLFPVYADEQEFVQSERGNHEKLALRLEHHNIPLWVDPNRPNMMDPKYDVPDEEESCG